MKRFYKLIASSFIMAAMLSIMSISAYAISWDGSSGGGGGGGVPAGPNGYAVRTTGDNCLGYRFSVVDKYGNTKNGAVIDVFRNNYYGNLGYSLGYKFYDKCNKSELIRYQNSGFSTGRTTSNCLKESNMGFSWSLPQPSGMSSWQNSHSNLNPVLRELGIWQGVSGLKNGDKVLVEPIYDVRLQGIYHSVTTTELAIYGKHILGAYSDGGASWNSGSWGFISSYTNKHYPNYLYTPDGQGLWRSASYLSRRATFHTIINYGYGVGIAYTETKPDFNPSLPVKDVDVYMGYPSDKTHRYGTSTGSTLGNYTVNRGYPIMDDKVWFSFYFPKEQRTIKVRQSVRIKGGSWTTRTGYDNYLTEYNVALSPSTVSYSRDSYVLEARVDWIDDNGNVKKYGAVKTFYIPIRPKLNHYQVSIYDLEGKEIARCGQNGNWGDVYIGQKHNAKYTVTSSNSWTSYNNVNISRGYPTDIDTNVNLNKYSSFERYSSKGYERMYSSTNYNRFIFNTSWITNPSKTTERTSFFVNTYRADVELSNIRLIDENGYYVSTIYQGQKVTPQYVYKNNTKVAVYVDGYDYNRNFIGTYKIPAYGTIYVNGPQKTITESSRLLLWGGVYLEGAGLGNTGWETTGTNNEKTLNIEISKPIDVGLIPNTQVYREGTDVITSYKVRNDTELKFFPNNGITVDFKVYNGNSLIYSTSKSNVVVPDYNGNLVYFKWRVPTTGLRSVKMISTVYANGYKMYQRTDTNNVIPPNVSATPDTQFEKYKPSGFTANNPPYKNNSASATWSEWIYSGGFQKKTYTISLRDVVNSITPDTNCPSKSYTNGKWTMASGYGFTSQVKANLNTGNAPYSAYTNIQTASMYVPEYGYSQVKSQYRAMDLSSTNTFELQPNPNAKNNAKLHFTPLWYPNGSYKTQVYLHDIWTPAGMINGYYNSNELVIKDSAYDDWYIGG